MIMKEQWSWSITIQRLFLIVCIIFLANCGFTIVKKEELQRTPKEAMAVPHPTELDTQCYTDEYMEQFYRQIDLCLAEDK